MVSEASCGAPGKLNLKSTLGQVGLYRLTKCCLIPWVMAELVMERSSALRSASPEFSALLP